MEQPPDHLVTVGKKRPQQAVGQLGVVRKQDSTEEQRELINNKQDETQTTGNWCRTNTCMMCNITWLP